MTDKKTIPGKFVWFEHISNDAKRAQAFYAEVFGWKAQSIPGFGDYEMILAGDSPDDMIGGYAAPKHGEPAHWSSCVSVPDVDAAAKAATQAGGTVVVAPHDMPGVGRGAQIRDPQGAALWLMHAEQGDPADRKLAPLGTFFWNELHTTQPEAAVEFYKQVVGYEHKAQPMGPGETYHLLESAGEGRGGVTHHLAPGVPPHWLPYVHVADPDATIARARSNGGQVHMDAMDIPGVGRFGVIADPTGAVLAVMKPVPPQT